MSKRSEIVAAEECIAIGASQRKLEAYPNRDASLGELPVSRALPIRERRLVGPWCFLDRFGPLTFSDGKPMDVAPHPHIGLQTVSWLHEGEVLHDDSLGSASILLEHLCSIQIIATRLEEAISAALYILERAQSTPRDLPSSIV